MIYVTHDQREAMALADRIAVMDRGRVLQVATPSELYREPADATVASFIGAGMIVPVRVTDVDGASCDADVFGQRVRMRCAPGTRAGPDKRACVRAADLTLASADGVPVTLARAVYQGGHFRVETAVAGAPEVRLHLSVPEPFDAAPGAILHLRIGDGWVIPGARA
jgi:iron(III) transport system ATP-binding protein